MHFSRAEATLDLVLVQKSRFSNSQPQKCISQEKRYLQSQTESSCSKAWVAGSSQRRQGAWCLVPPQRPQECRGATLARAAAAGLLQTLLHFVLRRDLPLLRPAAAGSTCSRRRRVRGSVALLECRAAPLVSLPTTFLPNQAPLSTSKQGSWENLTSGVSVLQAPNTCNQTLL